MKLTKISLAVVSVLALGSSSFASDNLVDAFKNGKVKGELKAYYFDRDKGASEADIVTTGVMLNYVTGSFKGFKFGATFQSSASPFANSDAKNVFKKDMYGSGAVLSEGYLAYTMGKTTAKVGRQFIKTPLVAGSGSRLIKESFEGAVLVNKDIPKTTLIAAYVDKYQSRTDLSGNIAVFEDVYDDGAYTLAVINKSFPGLTLIGQYADATDTVKLVYLEGKYAGKEDSFSYNLAAQYNDTNYDAATSKDSNFYALKAGVGMGGLKAYVAYSKTNDDNAAVAGVGKGPYGTYYTKSLIGSSVGIVNKAGAEAYAIDANYAIKGAKVGARYISLEANAGYEETRYNLYGSYKFTGALKGLKTDLIYEDQGKDADLQELWFKATYKF
ncbi:OprD family outer membrane porin [Sulfurospirillum sp. 1307]